MTTLISCPEDLLLATFIPLGAKDLLNLLSTCKRFFSLAQALLHRQVEFKWDKENEQNMRVDLFARSLVENPALRFLTHRVAFQGSRPNTIWQQSIGPHLSRHDLELLERQVFKTELSSAAGWKEALHKGSTDFFIAFLLSQLFNLKILELDFEFHVESYYTGVVLLNALHSASLTKEASSFAHINQVVLCKDKIERKYNFLKKPGSSRALQLCPTNFDELTPFLFLRSISSLTSWIQNPTELTWPAQRPWTSTLTSLSLHQSEVRLDTLQRVLSATSHLTRLEYQYHGTTEEGFPESTPDCMELDCVKLSDALYEVRNTIEYIHVSTSWYSRCGDELEWASNWGIVGNLKSLRQYDCLKILIVPLVVLFGWSPSLSSVRLADRLPKHIRELRLTDDMIFFDGWEWTQKDYLERFRLYLQDWRDHTPDLKRVSFHISDKSSYRWASNVDRQSVGIYFPSQDILRATEHQRELKNICDQSGVAFHVIRFGEIMDY